MSHFLFLMAIPSAVTRTTHLRQHLCVGVIPPEVDGATEPLGDAKPCQQTTLVTGQAGWDVRADYSLEFAESDSSSVSPDSITDDNLNYHK